MRIAALSGGLYGVLFFAATGNVHAQATVPIVEVSAPVAVSKEVFGTVLNVRALSNGNVLVNDGLRRQLLLLDSTLTSKTILLDSAGGAQSYGPRASPLITYLGDSTLFVDGASSSLLLIDPFGHITRTLAAPQARDLRFLSGSASGVDGSGNLVYRVAMIAQQQRATKPGDPTVISVPDSAAIVRANFTTRVVDTIARVRVNNGSRTESIRDDAGALVSSKFIINPVDVFDEWAVLSSGTVAIVRGQDYHIDWIENGGERRSTAKLPFDWKALTEGDKQRIVDSVRAIQEKALDASIAAAKQGTLGGMATGSTRAAAIRPQVTFVPFSAMSDYQPALRPGAARADLDGNLWVLPNTSSASKNGELVYDVVNERGGLFRRVRLPVGRAISGFGRGGILYLTGKGSNGWSLERVTLKK